MADGLATVLKILCLGGQLMDGVDNRAWVRGNGWHGQEGEGRSSGSADIKEHVGRFEVGGELKGNRYLGGDCRQLLELLMAMRDGLSTSYILMLWLSDSVQSILVSYSTSLVCLKESVSTDS